MCPINCSFGLDKNNGQVYAQDESDIEPPSQTHITNISGSTRKLLITWAESSDNIGVAGYIVYRNSVEIGRVSVTEFYDETLYLMGEGDFSYTVSAYDQAGNVSEMSPAGVIKIKYNNNPTPPPSGTLEAPKGLTAQLISNIVNLKWSASDASQNVIEYIIYRNDVEVGRTNFPEFIDRKSVV